MNQNVKRFSPLRQALFTGAIAAVTALIMPAWSSSVSATLKDSPKALLDEAWQIVNREFVDSQFNKVNWQAQREELLSKNYTSREEAYTALRKTLEKLKDPYTRFMDPKQYEALTNQTAGELSGVGMQLTVDEKTKAIVVVEPIKNSPAIKAGIMSGDKVLSIDGVSTTGMTVEQAANKIRGSVGTNVNLRIGREGQKEFDLTLTRARIELETVTYRVNNEGNRKIGYIQLREFNSHAAEQMQAAIQALTKENVQGFVLDLRGNPGGLLRTSIDIARMWMDTGAIVSTVDRDGKTQEIRNNRTAITKLPVVVLVDSNSASASEILAGALKDNQRGVVMGTQTFGKALVQSVFSLSDGSGLAVTIAHYYTPNGIDISHKGVTPDVKVDISDAQKKQLATDPKLVGTSQDPFYAKAISILAGVGGNRPLAINESK
ncbi:MAG TPA: peptidase S41 [Planktothrix sp. UBA8407]|jgi:C-terminal peptidase (prc)|nr:peptidase S41 [Planktothrix sp. UBA8402]HAO09880.1 peptidase S41 [Planktothrix sp. UBA8407]HBK25081.1 peptidase S41 [Planktothrix sp. UBA10369]